MSSLHDHLARHDAAASPIAFRRDCPLCRAERLHGQLPNAALVPPRACAAITAVILATSAAAPGSVVADGQGVAVPAPPAPPPPPAAGVSAGGGGAAPVDLDDGGGNASSESQRPDTAGGANPTPASRADQASAATSNFGAVADAPADADGTARAPHTDASPASPGLAVADHQAPPAGDDNSPGEQPGSTSAPSTPLPSQAATPTPTPVSPPAPQGSATPNEGGTSVSESGRSARAPRSSGDDRRAHSSAPSTVQGTLAPSPRSSRRATRKPTKSADRMSPQQSAHTTSARPAASSRASAPATEGRGRQGSATAGDAHRGTTSRHTALDVRTPAMYQVQPGDSLWRIASRHLGSSSTALETAREVSRLWELNAQRIGTGNPDLIFPGQTLRV